MRVELLWWRGCPSWERAIEIVREQMAVAGLDPETLVVREIVDEQESRREGFPGSPTILVNGSDIQEPGQHPSGLTCRVYRLRDGRVSALPDPADIAAALAAAREGSDEVDGRS
ncbi:MAG: hypothetical protein ACHQJ5_04340 [Vicinamibacteria bacterium]